jgi:CRP-like cAMP-binding protein
MEQIRQYFEKICKLTDRDWQIFSSKLIRQEFPPNHILLKAGQIENYLSFIEKGIIRFYIPKEENELTFYFVFDNSFVSGYSSFLTQTPAVYQVETLTKNKNILWSL